MTTIDIFKNRGDFCDLLIKKYNLKHCKIVKKLIFKDNNYNLISDKYFV